MQVNSKSSQPCSVLSHDRDTEYQAEHQALYDLLSHVKILGVDCVAAIHLTRYWSNRRIVLARDPHGAMTAGTRLKESLMP